MAPPESFQDLMWYAFNGVLLILVWRAKADLSEIKSDTKKNREMQEENALKIAITAAACTEKHKNIDSALKVLFEHRDRREER